MAVIGGKDLGSFSITLHFPGNSPLLSASLCILRFIMADPIQEVPGAIDPFISQLENPDPVHDINPASAATAATEATEVSAASKEDLIESAPASDANSIDSDVVHPHRVIKQAHQRQRFPPLPDLRFEHNFNASLEGADTWGKVTWIIVRDQVQLPSRQITEIKIRDTYG